MSEDFIPKHTGVRLSTVAKAYQIKADKIIDVCKRNGFKSSKKCDIIYGNSIDIYKAINKEYVEYGILEVASYENAHYSIILNLLTTCTSPHYFILYYNKAQKFTMHGKIPYYDFQDYYKVSFQGNTFLFDCVSDPDGEVVIWSQCKQTDRENLKYVNSKSAQKKCRQILSTPHATGVIANELQMPSTKKFEETV